MVLGKGLGILFDFITADNYHFIGLLVFLENISHSIETIGRHLFTLGQLLIDHFITVVVVGALYGAVDKETHGCKQFKHQVFKSVEKVQK